jgi:hypothetical protein
MFIRENKSRFSALKRFIAPACGILLALAGAGVHIAGLIIRLLRLGG